MFHEICSHISSGNDLTTVLSLDSLADGNVLPSSQFAVAHMTFYENRTFCINLQSGMHISANLHVSIKFYISVPNAKITGNSIYRVYAHPFSIQIDTSRCFCHIGVSVFDLPDALSFQSRHISSGHRTNRLSKHIESTFSGCSSMINSNRISFFNHGNLQRIQIVNGSVLGHHRFGFHIFQIYKILIISVFPIFRLIPLSHQDLFVINHAGSKMYQSIMVHSNGHSLVHKEIFQILRRNRFCRHIFRFIYR